MLKFFRRLYWNMVIIGNDQVGYNVNGANRSLWASRRETLLEELVTRGL